MPIVIVNMMEGSRRRQEGEGDRRRSPRRVVETLDAKPESVRVILQEYPKQHWGIAGKPVGEPAVLGVTARRSASRGQSEFAGERGRALPRTTL